MRSVKRADVHRFTPRAKIYSSQGGSYCTASILGSGDAWRKQGASPSKALSSSDSSDDKLSTLLILIFLVVFLESGLGFFVVGLDRRERLLNASQAHLGICFWRTIEVFLFAVSLNLFTFVSNLD